MKKLLSILLLISLCVASRAGSLVTATITLTDVPADGDTIEVNGSTRTWKTTVATPASQILIGADVEESRDNMFQQFASTPFTTLSLNRSGTDIVTLRGIVDQAISVTIVGTWGGNVNTTQTTGEGSTVRVPGSSYQDATKAADIFSQLVTDISSFSDDAFTVGSDTMLHFVDHTSSQTLSNKTLIAAIINGTSTTNIDAGVSELWVAGDAHIQDGDLSLTNATPVIKIYESGASAEEATWSFSVDAGTLSFLTTEDDGTGGENILVVTRTAAAIDDITFPNGAVNVINFKAAGQFEITRLNHTAFANGNNAAADFTDATFVKIKAGPSAAFAICGIAGGSNGRVLHLYNATGQNMTISNDSGVDATAANRIYTGTGSDIATTANGFVSLIYDSEDSRWVVMSIRD